MKLKIIIIILQFTIILPAFSEQSLALKDAVSTAFESNNELRSFKYSLSANKKDIGIERSALLPKLRFEENFTSTNDPADAFGLKVNQSRVTASDLTVNTLNHPNPVNNFLTAITFEQPILDRKANINIGIAKTDYSSKNFDYLRKREDIAARVTYAYFDVDRDKKLVLVAQKNVEDEQQNLKVAQIKYNDKTAFYSATLRASAALTDSKQLLVTAKNNLEVAKRSLGLVLGKQESIDIIENDYSKLNLKDASYYNNASSARNDIKSIELKYENAKNNVKLAEADYFPTIGIASSYRLCDHRAPFALEGHNYVATGFFRWDAFDGLKRKNEKSKTQDLVGEAWENLEGFKKDVSFQVFKAYIAVEGARENLRLSEVALKDIKEGREIVLDKYKNSQLQLVDLLDVQTNLNLARSNMVIQENNYVDALIALSFASGTTLDVLGIK